jgi:hypothetical protein
MRAFLVLVFAVSVVALATPTEAACRKVSNGFGGYNVYCDDGNQYNVQKNDLTGTTTMRGHNPNTGSSWNSQYQNNGFTVPTMRGQDSQGNQYNCRMNSFTNQWQCH